MQIYKEFGQNANRLAFSETVLIALSRAPDPQAAFDEANERKEQGESVTAKQAKEHCDIKETQCTSLMRIYREFGQKPTALGFSVRALLEL